MGVFQDETFFDALKLALAARMLSPWMALALPGQFPIIFLTPPICYYFMNPTATKPLTILNPYLSIPGSTKTLRPSYVAIPLSYVIIPLHIIQAQTPPPHPTTSPHPPDSTFWNVVEQAVERSVYEAAALAWLLSEIAKAIPQKDLAPAGDDQWLPSYDSLDLSSLPSIPTKDDLLRMDMTELELIPSSELYIGEVELATAKPATPKLLSSKSKPPPPPRSSHSNTTLDTLLESYLPGEDLSVIFQIPDDELYFDLEHPGESGATPPRPSSSSAFAIPSTLPSA